MTASTAELVNRFERTHSSSREKSEPPAHAVPFTLIAVVTAYVLVFLPTGITLDYAEVSAAAVLSAALLGLTLLWPLYPGFATLGIPLGYIALASAERERGGEGRMAALYGLVGAINLPIIHYSVLWWRTLHQGESIGLTGSTIDNSILWPLPLTMVGFTCLFGAAVLMRMRAELAEAKLEARMRRMGAE